MDSSGPILHGAWCIKPCQLRDILTRNCTLQAIDVWLSVDGWYAVVIIVVLILLCCSVEDRQQQCIRVYCTSMTVAAPYEQCEYWV